MTPNQTFLLRMRDDAKAGGHCFPEYAACEAAVDTAWGTTASFAQGTNPFGHKQRAKAVHQTLNVPAPRVVNGQKIDGTASFIKFPDLTAAFRYRMDTLKQFRAIYRDALQAETGEGFVRNVSGLFGQVKGIGPADPANHVYEFSDGLFQFVKPRWSNDPGRASEVLAIYEANKGLFA
jgi:hypothetical protein